MSLLESLDEALKSLGQEQFMAKTLGGTYSDQKICKDCPHRLVYLLYNILYIPWRFNDLVIKQVGL